MIKKALITLGIFILGGISVVLISSQMKNERERDLPHIQPLPEMQVHKTGYTGHTAVTGPDFTLAAEKTVNAVVHIRSQFLRKSNTYDDFFGALREYFGYDQPNQRQYPISGWGSGVIISSEGFIVTNNHVVSGAELVEVTLNDKRTYEAEIVGTDPTTDLAVIRIKERGLPFVRYGNSDEVRVGEWVLAVGNPFNLTSTVTAGIVSAKARDINILGNQAGIESFIQTDAAVNRGNSGGALVNNKGALIGINAAIASNTGSYTGYSFAIPVNIVRKVVEDIMLYGDVQRAYLGVVVRDIDSDFAEEMGLKNLKGLYVEAISESGGAEASGIERGDVITHINGIEVNSLSQLLEVVGQFRPGDEVWVDVYRGRKTMKFNVELKNEDGTTSVIKKEEKFYQEKLGATLQRITNEEKRIYRIKNGLKISSVEPDGILSSGGIRKGFIIVMINDKPVSNKSSLDRAIKSSEDFIKIQGVYPNGMRVTYEFGL